MARSVRARIETRSARLRLRPGKQPYWIGLEKGLALGYHRPISGGAGTWWGRVRVDGRYMVESLAAADDHVETDGGRVLDWRGAQASVRAWAGRRTHAGPLTVADAVVRYVDDLHARKGRQAAHEAGLSLTRHLLPVLGAVRLIDLTDAMVRIWRNKLVVESDDPERVRKSRDTANRIMNYGLAALNFAHRGGLVADDRAWRLVKRFPGVGRSRKVILTGAQIQALVEACRPGLRELVVVGALTGARWGELTNASVCDFDPAAATLALTGKTGPRTILLPPAAVLLLRRLAIGRSPGDPLLTTASGSRWTENMHRRGFFAAATKADLPAGTVFYSLRHSYLSRGLREGIPITALARHCGTSVHQIARSYAKELAADSQRYVALAAPDLRLDAEVVQLRTA